MNHCGKNPHKNGKDRQDFQRWRCPVCGLTWSDSPEKRKPGVKPRGDRAMTSAEKQQAYRDRRKQ